jgi:ATP-dependent helicase/nuclease subunit A
MTAPALPDRDARRRAATDFDRNLVVIAGAGTGKTSLLVERFLNLVLSGRMTIREVTAITFTEKAAGEMRERVAQALDDVLAATDSGAPATSDERTEAGRSLEWLLGERGPAPAEVRARAIEALEELDAAAISTIHSFCSDLLRRNAVAADLPPEFSVDEGLAQELQFEDAWPEFLAAELGPRAERTALWERVLSAFTEEAIEDVARATALDPAACDLLAREGYRALDPVAAFGEPAAALLEDLAAYRDEVTGKRTAKMQAFMDTALVLLRAFLDGGPEALRDADPAGFPLSKFWERDDAFSPGKDLGERAEEIRSRSVEALKFLKTLREIDEGAFPDLFEALRPFARDFRLRAVREGKLAFEDLLLLTRDLLRDRPAVRALEAARHRAILLDEFQDTDPLQYEIVFYLAAAKPSAAVEDPFATGLAPGRLFIVGDPKQSIYRFRGADMAAFVRARDRVLAAGATGSLLANFRSVPEVLDPLNALFEGWMGPATETDRDVEPDYEPIAAARRPAGDGPRVELWSVRAPEGTKTEFTRAAEAKAMAQKVLELTGSPFRNRTLTLRDFAVLFRSLNDAAVYGRAFREAGIDFVVDGGKAFRERPEVVEALALLAALANPADPVATLAVLRSSFGGVPDPELAAYAAAGGRFYWPGAARRQIAFPAVAGALGRLDRLHDATSRLPVDRRIMALLTEGEFLLAQGAFVEGAQRTANVRKLAERAATLAREQGLTLERAIAWLRDEFTGNRTEGESPLADEAVDAVRFLTIHKAKGLEFPVVFVPDLNRGTPPAQAETRVAVQPADGGRYVAAVQAGRRAVRNVAAVIADRENRRHEEAERKRLLYVATTRAEDRLILLNSGVTKLSPWVKALQDRWGYRIDKKNGDDPFAGNGQSLCGGQVAHRSLLVTEGPSEPAPRAEVDAAGAARAVRAAAEAAAGAAARRWRTPSADHRARATDAAARETELPHPRERDLARAAGLAVHAALEHADFAEPGAIPSRLEASARAAAGELGLDPAAVRAAAEAALAGFLASNLPARLAAAEILGRETAVLFRDADGTTVHGYADLVYRTGGRVHVADYKTDAGKPAELAAAYRDQLRDYVAAVRTALALDAGPVAELILVRSGERVEVDLG